MELLTTLVIIGIFSIIALSLHTRNIAHAKREAAEVALSKLANALEQYYLVNNTYENATIDKLHVTPPKDYQLEIVSATQSSFNLAAYPTTTQDNACGTLTLNSNNEKGATGANLAEGCW